MDNVELNWNAALVQPLDQIHLFQGSDELTRRSRLLPPSTPDPSPSSAWAIVYSTRGPESYLAVKSQKAKIRKQRETKLGESSAVASLPAALPVTTCGSVVVAELHHSFTTVLPDAEG